MKKKIIIFGILLTVGILGFIIYGYYQATPALTEQTASRPRIEVSPKSYDFGEIAFGRIVDFTFKVKNSGDEILEIKRLATSCGCTTAKINKDKINPGEEADVLVTYDTAAMGNGPHGKGQQERIIYIKSNDPVNPQITTTINAYVK